MTKFEGRLLVTFIVVCILAAVWQVHRDNADSLARMQLSISAVETERKADANALVETLSEISAVKRATVTPAQVIRELPTVIQLPAPISLTGTAPAQAVGAQGDGDSAVGKSGGGNQPAISGVISPPYADGQGATIPAVDLKPLFDRLADCKACEATRTEQAGEIRQLTQERDKAVQTAKGGTFWHRLKHDAKVIGITLAVGAAVGYAAHR